MATEPNTCLLLIDFQQAFSLDPAYFGSSISSAPFEKSVTRLRQHFRDHGFPVIHVHHYSQSEKSPLHASKPGVKFLPFAEPKDNEQVFSKTVNSAFIGTNLEHTLKDMKVRRLVVAGLTTEHCVSTTVRMAANLDVVQSSTGAGEIILVEDACAAFAKGDIDAETVHRVNLACLDGEFCTVLSTEKVVKLVGSGTLVIR